MFPLPLRRPIPLGCALEKRPFCKATHRKLITVCIGESKSSCLVCESMKMPLQELMAERNGFCCMMAFWRPMVFTNLNDPENAANKEMKFSQGANYKSLIVSSLHSFVPWISGRKKTLLNGLIAMASLSGCLD